MFADPSEGGTLTVFIQSRRFDSGRRFPHRARVKVHTRYLCAGLGLAPLQNAGFRRINEFNLSVILEILYWFCHAGLAGWPKAFLWES